jgi:hypothetical protein
MFGFIKNLFSGIISFFTGLLGGKKSQDNTLAAPKTKKSKGYFLEIDDSGNLKTEVEAKKPEPAKTALATAEPPKSQPAPKAETAPKAAKSEPATVVVPSAAQNGKVEQVQVQAQPNPPAPQTNGKVAATAEGTFAPKYLIPTPTNNRRRPGPSMDMFRDMARQVKTPS